MSAMWNYSAITRGPDCFERGDCGASNRRDARRGQVNQGVAGMGIGPILIVVENDKAATM
jgi:hypothetical protein